MKRFISALLIIIMLFIFTACKDNGNSDNGDIKIVATMFAEYDLSRHIAGDKAQVSMLLPPGSESHSYEPTPQDIIRIKNADIFIYGGGESDTWLDSVLSSVGEDKMKIISLMDICELKEEEIIEGMEVHEEENEDEPEYDEHVWTSPVNAVLILKKIYSVLSSSDPENADYYKANTESYINEIEVLNTQFRKAVSEAKRKEIVFGDRFPFRYFADEYGLKYYAAFPGCSENTEPGTSTMKFLIDKVREDDIPVIFKIEFSTGNVAQAISDETGARVLEFHSCHNITAEQLKSGVSYVELMKQNLENLKIALN